MDHTHENPQKIQTEWKVQESSKNRPTASETGGQIKKIEILSVISFTEDTLSNYGKRLKKQLDPEGNVNLTAFSFSKGEYKLLNKNFNFIPTPKVYNKNKLDNDLNNFFTPIKLKAHFKDPINKDIDDKNRIFKVNKNICWTPGKNHYTTDKFAKIVKKISNVLKVSNLTIIPKLQ